MTRSQRFLSGLLTGYAALGTNILCTLTSIPLALHYLSKEEFGLWALITQLTGYLILLEFGISGSVARFLSDHKDEINGGDYGSVLITGLRMFTIQGLLVMVLGIAAAILGPRILDLPSHLREIFVILASIQAALTGVTLVSRAAASPLWPHQRHDIINFAAILSLLCSLITLWISLHYGLKLYSLALAAIVGFLASFIVSVSACFYLKLYPSRGHWGRYDNKLFLLILHYGKGLFMLNFGWQLISASQVIIISRLLGLESASIWSVSTKLATMVQQFVMKLFDSSAAGFAELLVRGEQARLLARFRDLMSATSVLSLVGATGIIFFNSPLIETWTSGKIYWNDRNNLLLGIVVYCICITRTLVGIVSLHKDLAAMKYATLCEGLLFVLFASYACQRFGFVGILGSSIICNLLVTGWYAVARSSNLFKLPCGSIAGWSIRPTLMLLPVTGLYSIFDSKAFHDLEPGLEVVIKLPIFIFLFLPTVWWIAIPRDIKAEFARRATVLATLLFARLLRR